MTVRVDTWVLRRTWRVATALATAAMVIGFAAVRVGNRWLVGVAGALIAVAVSAVWPAGRPRLAAELHGPQRTAVGDTVQHELVVHGLGRGIERLTVGVVQPGLSSVLVSVVDLPAEGALTVPITRTACQRTVADTAELVLTVGTELNQVTFRQNVSCPAPVIVHPRRVGAPPEPNLPPPSGRGGELLGARAFRSGDALRAIHWRASARHRGLIVAERGADEPPPALVLIIGRPTTEDDEQILALAAALAGRRIAAGEPVRVLAWHGTRCLTAPSRSVTALADWFAGLVEPSVPTVEAVLARATDAGLTIAASNQTPPMWVHQLTTRLAAHGTAPLWLRAEPS